MTAFPRIRSELLRGLRSVHFEDDELAYLALTSKPERLVCDRLAWQLQKDWRLEERMGNVIAAREWHRRDLAVLDNTDIARAVLEAKAFFSFEALPGSRHLPRYLDDIERDLEKVSSLPEVRDTTEQFAMFVVTHVRGMPRPEFDPIIKHASHYRRRRVKLAEANESLLASLEKRGFGPRSHVRLGHGCAFKLRASVGVWLCGPLGK